MRFTPVRQASRTPRASLHNGREFLPGGSRSRGRGLARTPEKCIHPNAPFFAKFNLGPRGWTPSDQLLDPSPGTNNPRKLGQTQTQTSHTFDKVSASMEPSLFLFNFDKVAVSCDFTSAVKGSFVGGETSVMFLEKAILLKQAEERQIYRASFLLLVTFLKGNAFQQKRTKENFAVRILRCGVLGKG